MMLERAAPSAAARKRARKRRYRCRQASGMVVLRVECSEHDLAEALLRSGRLSPKQALYRGELEKAAGVILSDFIARWGMRVSSADYL